MKLFDNTKRVEQVRTKIIWTLLVLFLAVPQLFGAAQRAETQGFISLNLTNVSMKNTLELLTRRMGKNLLLDPSLGLVQLNIVLRDVTPRQAFDAIMEANHLGYTELAGEIYYVAGIEKITNSMVVKDIPLKYSVAAELEDIIKRLSISNSGSVMSDARTNSLIVKEHPEVIEKIEHLIAELDRPARQVYIQAEILEVSSTDGKEFGVEWLMNDLKLGSFDARVGTDFRIGKTGGKTDVNDSADEDFPFPNRTKSGLGIGILNTDISAVLHALNEMSNVNLLSRPRIVTVDNQESVITVGDQIPFKKLNEFGITSFEFKDATVELLVIPHVIDDEYILLDVAPKADFQNGFTLDGTPIISTRRASTNVKVGDGQTIVIGGLIRDSIVRNVRRVPLLGSIPVLGALFSSQRSTRIKTELIVFITPVILQDELEPAVFDGDFQKRQNVERDFE